MQHDIEVTILVRVTRSWALATARDGRRSRSNSPGFAPDIFGAAGRKTGPTAA